ncbi:uncharacterized protein BBA_09606 [Beauveria bassiana ARSEF 2860]|uniref:Uncharacterized protein n=1 Tax=Beauveria bassiana (strain ARSEF 2860) TaxID=655819 RepID=J4VS88_BEAB2|nr:uncharacterized protein BBA_09606 [Beauveria bassiana ARSEF 2860]EJP61470.1 hypothetical protein BBA_09606 [Beauveria bassiana ARSEF 2860]
MTSTASPKRWSTISASANAEAEYRTVYDDPSTAHDCDGGISCLCQKLASQPYGHPWIVSRAGYRKFLTQHLHSYLRNPDFFDMYTFNDHYGYGQLEMMQNLLLDFADADPLWREQWAIVEGAVLWLLDVESTPMLQIGTGHDLVDIFDLIGRMFVAMVARLERENLLSEIPSLGAVMSMFVGLFTRLRKFDIVEKTRKITGASDYDARRLASYVLAYSKQYNITLTSYVDSEAYQEDWGEIKLPTPTMNKNDPWGFFGAVRRYHKRHSKGMAFHYCGFVGIGGDALDITTWKSDERLAKSLSKKDPLEKEDIDAIKQGLVLHSSEYGDIGLLAKGTFFCALQVILAIGLGCFTGLHMSDRYTFVLFCILILRI